MRKPPNMLVGNKQWRQSWMLFLLITHGNLSLFHWERKILIAVGDLFEEVYMKPPLGTTIPNANASYNAPSMVCAMLADIGMPNCPNFYLRFIF